MPRRSPRPKALTLPPLGTLPLPAKLAYPGAVVSGLLYWLAFAGMDVWPLTFVALVPLVLAIHRQAPRRALALGTVAGLTMNACGFSWLLGMLRDFSGFGTPLCLVFMLIVCAYQGGRIGLLGWLYARATARHWPAPAVFLSAFAASELLYPLLFPWYYAATVHQVPLLTQTAELGGPILVGLVLAGANLAIAEPLLARAERRSPIRGVVVGGAAVLALAMAFGAWRIHGTDARVAGLPEVHVGMVQANMSLKGKREDANEGLTRHLHATRKLRDEGVDFVVWSETSAMRPMLVDDFRRTVPTEIGRQLGVPALFGAVLVKPDPDPRRRYVFFNSALSTDVHGAVNGRYDKEFLLAFGEYIPFGDMFPALYGASPNSGRFSAGTDLTPLTIDTGDAKHTIAMLICYEDILPSFTNKVVAATSPELLVNMTNDAWFGNSSEPWEHLALAQFRAIEHRRFLVRSTNSGVSAIVDPVGRVVVHTTPFEELATRGSVRWMTGRTVYEVVGDSIYWLLAAAVVAGSFVKRRAAWGGPSA
jgi:apolipoprotein N-acyltransferase